MNWETKNLIEQIDIIKRKINDAVTTFAGLMMSILRMIAVIC